VGDDDPKSENEKGTNIETHGGHVIRKMTGGGIMFQTWIDIVLLLIKYHEEV
jgi:hypothetical protein